ncbi:Carbamate kinase [Reticulomyxa filosa]|uniref:Carbamate kinase n=1 Tax=Reticulomyxa filosa TaxID=46433 RepID=X6PBE8_RETFI|nr:Carbamate kinase [Reticulomyxa filosa]|eukprot:ETO35501.1 Carbamate kinase [Reticulomyxa filosa]
MCYLGDCHNNVTYDLMRSACVLGFHLNVCGPVNAGNGKEHNVDDEVLEECKDICKQYHKSTDLNKWLTITDKPEVALRDNIDVIYTDSWMSYGVDPKDKEKRMRTFMPYQVDTPKLKMAKPNCIFMNCLPAIRGMEQAADVIDGPQSVVFDQAENRLHGQKALLFYLVHGHMDVNQLCTEQDDCGYKSCKDTGSNNKWHKCENTKDQCEKKRILVALGGNALKKPKEKGTNEEMLENVRESCRQMVKLIDHHKYQLIVTHGNGPQVGSLFFQQQVSQEVTPAMPLNVCGAMSQGQIGYMLQQCLYNELLKDGHNRDEQLHDKIVTIVTQVVVDPSDPAWGSPSKPVGKFMSKDEALALQKEKGYFIAQLCDDGYIIIASGGGGIPVVRGNLNSIEGRDAVIDKDLAAVLLGVSISADVLMIATDVDAVYLNYTKGAEKKKLEKMTVAEAKEYYKAGHFAKGSMGPKILAAIEFVEKTGKVCIIGSLDQIEQAIRGEKGTVIRYFFFCWFFIHINFQNTVCAHKKKKCACPKKSFFALLIPISFHAKISLFTMCQVSFLDHNTLNVKFEIIKICDNVQTLNSVSHDFKIYYKINYKIYIYLLQHSLNNISSCISRLKMLLAYIIINQMSLE